MVCTSCGTTLSPGVATCPACSKPTPYNVAAPHTPLQPFRVPTQEQPSPMVPQQQRVTMPRLTVLVILLVLLIIGGSGIGYYAVAVRPTELQAQATAVTRNLLATQTQGTAQAYAQATATTVALTPQEIYTRATSGTPVINDSLDVQEGSTWLQQSSSLFSCAFSSGAYHVRSLKQVGFTDCIAFNSLFNNLAFQVQLKIIAGAAGGLMFRLTNNGAYFFGVEQNTSYYLIIFKDNVPSLLTAGSNAAINPGPNQPNLLTVVAESNHIYLYVNKQPIANVTNSVFDSGQVALYAASATGPADVAFSDVQVWAL